MMRREFITLLGGAAARRCLWSVSVMARAFNFSFDQPIGAREQRWRHLETECLSRLEIDH